MFSLLLSLIKGAIEPSDLIMEKMLSNTPKIRNSINKTHEKLLYLSIPHGSTFDRLTPTIVKIADDNVNNMVDLVFA